MTRRSAGSEGMGGIHDRESIDLEPISVRIPRAVQLTGISRTSLYALISTGQLEVTKVGRSTLINYRSLRRLIDRD